MTLRPPDDLGAKLTERARREGRSKQELAVEAIRAAQDRAELKVDEILAIARTVNGTEHSVRDMGLPVSAVERPRTNAFGAESYPTLREKAAALLHSVARNLALIDGNERTAWLAMRVFLRFNGVSVSTVAPPGSVAGPFVEDVAQDDIAVPAVARRLSTRFPVS